MKVGTVLRHITHKDLLVLVKKTGRSTIQCEVIPSFDLDPAATSWDDLVKLPGMGVYKLLQHNVRGHKTNPVIELRLSRLNRSWKVDKVGTILYGQK